MVLVTSPCMCPSCPHPPPPADGQLVDQVVHQRVGHAQVALAVLKVDGVDLVGHGAAANLACTRRDKRMAGGFATQLPLLATLAARPCTAGMVCSTAHLRCAPCPRPKLCPFSRTRRPQPTRNGPLLEVSQADVAPHVAVEVHQDVVEADHGAVQLSDVVVRLDLRHVGVELKAWGEGVQEAGAVGE